MPKKRRSTHFVLVTRPGAATMRSITSAAALIARSDGSADEIERRALLRFLRSHDMLRRFGRRACMSAYRAALHDDTSDADVLAALEPQRGQAAAPLIAAAAAFVALADGRTHQAEADLLRAIAERLSLIGASDRVMATA